MAWLELEPEGQDSGRMQKKTRKMEAEPRGAHAEGSRPRGAHGERAWEAWANINIQ